MRTEEIIERLRHPQRYNKKAARQAARQKKVSAQKEAAQNLSNWIALGIAACVIGVAAIAWLVVLHAKDKAEDLSTALDPNQVQGLMYETEFNPNQNTTYVQIYEGQDRNVAVEQLGTTLPIISRFNYLAITPKNYGIIGMAPWALTENFAANLQDVQLIRYLLNRKEVGEAFLTRNDVAPLLEDPQLLGAFAQDNKALSDFFDSNTIHSLLENPDMVRAIGGSRFMSYLLTSKAVKYYRDRPQEAVKLIDASPALRALKQNAGVRQAVQENYYLKPIAAQLLGTPSTGAVKK